MTTGTITKVVRTHGSTWGRVVAEDGTLCFFNESSLKDARDFDALEPGQGVEFEVESDQVNGSRAVGMVLVGREIARPPVKEPGAAS